MTHCLSTESIQKGKSLYSGHIGLLVDERVEVQLRLLQSCSLGPP